MKRMFRSIIACLCLLLLLPTYAYAMQPDEAYTYSRDGRVVPSVNVYKVYTIIDAEKMGCTPLSGAQDIFVDEKDYVYILDSGNKRVVILDENYRCVRELTEFFWKGEVLQLADGAQGLFYRDETQLLYIADTKNNRIIVSDLDGNVIRLHEKPVAAVLDANTDFAPRKIIVDNMGLIFVTSVNVNTGALLIDEENNFLGFFGTNAIKETFEIKMEYLWRSILTDAQNAQSQFSFQPTEFYNIFWSNDRFVYAVSPVSDTVASPIVKLNALGKNTFSTETEFGDIGAKGSSLKPVFADITVDNEGVFTILDLSRGRLFQYDDSCNLLAIFGGLGSQRGLFTTPVSIESDSLNRILVLDAEKNNVTVLDQTFYGKKIRQATALFNEGRYREALEPWFEIIKMNANYDLAYVGIGKAYMKLDEYELAKENFRLAGDREGYSEAKEALRMVWLRENFSLIVCVVLLLMMATLFSGSIKKLSVKVIQRIRQGKGGN